MDALQKMDIKVGDRVYCDTKKKHGFVCRLNPLGLIKKFGIGVHWDDKSREAIFGLEECCKLIKK